MKILIPKGAQLLLEKLVDAGYEAFIVGGCVRDSLLHKTPNDWDITTNATPEQSKECLSDFRIFETGIQHGTITVRANHESYEITTYRIDGEYEDNRRPKEVQYSTSLKEDLARRDFTINAMAYDESSGLQDFFEGQKDLANKQIRCVGKATERFTEDALRILRALRFASELSFSIEVNTKNAMYACKSRLTSLSSERIRVELDRLLLGESAKAVLTEYRDILSVILPEIAPMFGFLQNNPYHCFDVWEHTVTAVVATPQEIVLRLAMLFHDIGKPHCYHQDEQGIGHFYGHNVRSEEIVRMVMNRLRYDNDTKNKVLMLVKHHDDRLLAERKPLKRMLNKLGETTLRQLIFVKRADTRAQAMSIQAERLSQLTQVEDLLNRLCEEKACFQLKDLSVNGNDFIQIGITNGKDIGMTLKQLLHLVIEEELVNEKEVLLQCAKQFSIKNRKDLENKN